MVLVQKVKNITADAYRKFMDYFDKDMYKVFNQTRPQDLVKDMYSRKDK
ncbi:MAG: hypothetical protein HRT47_09075 [Candidatus Caenarcaniphilales bacterium]|nr:hypothetical protein [Candidatus Caenarcaniphilales bacterium]